MNEWNELKKAFAPAPERFELRMQYTFEHMEDLTVKRRHHITLVAIVAVLVLMIGVALAAASFGVMDFLSYRNEDGTTTVNEALWEYVQPVQKEQEGSATRLTVQDAICDGTTFSLAWTLENQANEQVYVCWDAVLNDGEVAFNGGSMTGYEFFLAERERMDGGMSMNLDPLPEGDTVDVKVYFHVLAPKAAVLEGQALRDTMTEAEQQEALDKMEKDMTDGNLVIVGGEIELPNGAAREGEPKWQTLERLGLMKQVDSYEMSFQLNVTTQYRDLLQGQPMEHAFDGYRVILSEAKASPTQISYTVDYVFDSQESLEAFQDKWGYISIWPVTDEKESWFGNGNGDDQPPVKQADGTYLQRNIYTITDIWYMPTSITLLPGSFAKGSTKPDYHAEEAFVVRLAE